MAGDLCTALSIISLSPLSLADRRDWRDTRGKWSLARNPDRSWWHRYSSLQLHGQQEAFYWCDHMSLMIFGRFTSISWDFEEHRVVELEYRWCLTCWCGRCGHRPLLSRAWTVEPPWCRCWGPTRWCQGSPSKTPQARLWRGTFQCWLLRHLYLLNI